jgi:hypothetical protein
MLNEYFDSQPELKKGRLNSGMADRIFMQSIMSRPQPLPLSNTKLLEDSVARHLRDAQQYRYIELTGFQYCTHLEGTVIDSFASLTQNQKLIGISNPTSKELARWIDDSARKAFQYITDVYFDVDILVRIN